MRVHFQVQSLQKKLHASLNVYYRLRGMYNKAEIARMESESSENTRRVRIKDAFQFHYMNFH